MLFKTMLFLSGYILGAASAFFFGYLVIRAGLGDPFSISELFKKRK